MIKRLNPFVLSKDQEENSEIAEWAFQSHYWVEDYTGYYRCKWCNIVHNSMMSITKDFPLCRGNYAVKKLLEDKKSTK